MRMNQPGILWVAATLVAFSGCQTTGSSSRLSFWPFHKEKKPADALASSPPPAFPVKPSASAAPSSTPTGGFNTANGAAKPGAAAVAAAPGAPANNYAVPPSSPNGPAVDYGTPVSSSSTDPTAQVGRYDPNAYGGPPAAGYPSTPARPAAYETATTPPAYRDAQAWPAAAPAASEPRYDLASRYDEMAGPGPEASTAAGAPPVVDYGSPSDPPPSHGSAPADRYDQPPGAAAPAAGRNVPPAWEASDAGSGYDAPTEYEGYRPGETDYQPGRTGYQPPGTPAYQPVEKYSSPAGQYAPPPRASQPGGSPLGASSAASGADPHYRPGGTTDYVPPRKPAASSVAQPNNFTPPVDSRGLPATNAAAPYPSTGGSATASRPGASTPRAAAPSGSYGGPYR